MKLSAPLRICWDWNWPPVVMESAPPRRGDRKSREAVAAGLARSRVLLLEVGYPSCDDIRDGSLTAIVGAIGAGVSVVLAARDAGRLDAGELSALTGLGEVWIDATEDLEGRGAGPGRSGKGWPALRMYLTKNNIAAAAASLGKAIEGGTGKISLPILPLFGNFLKSPGNQIPSWRDLMTFADRLEPLLRRRDDLDLRVHYQALWTILKNRGIGAKVDEAPGHSGCQAASALGYVDPSGILYPCAALPIPLGRVTAEGLAAAWRSGEAGRLREAISGSPGLCTDCPVLESCRGGCRGWAHFLTGEWSEPGPDCGREIPQQGQGL